MPLNAIRRAPRDGLITDGQRKQCENLGITIESGMNLGDVWDLIQKKKHENEQKMILDSGLRIGSVVHNCRPHQHVRLNIVTHYADNTMWMRSLKTGHHSSITIIVLNKAGQPKPNFILVHNSSDELIHSYAVSPPTTRGIREGMAYQQRVKQLSDFIRERLVPQERSIHPDFGEYWLVARAQELQLEFERQFPEST